MYVQRNTEASSCSHCCSGKAISIAYSECVFVALGIQHAKRIRLIVICGLSGCADVCTLSHKGHDFRKKKKVTEHKVCFVFLYNFCLKHFFSARKIPRNMQFDI